MKKYQELIRKLSWSLLFLFILEIGKNIYVPRVVMEKSTFPQQTLVSYFLSATTGGKYNVPTLFSLGMSPYMTGVIVWSTITMIKSDKIDYLSESKKSVLQKAIVFLFAVLQAMTLAIKFKTSIQPTSYLSISSITMSYFVIVLVLTTGAMFLAWLADMNQLYGIGGASIFILPSLISNLPAMLVSGNSYEGVITMKIFLYLLILTLLFMSITLYLYRAEYRISIERTGIVSDFTRVYIPIKVLTAGALPYMFALTVFSLPNLILLNSSIEDTKIAYFLVTFFSFNTVAGILMYGLLIFILGLGFSFINVRPYDIAKNMKYSGEYILNIVPGKETQNYIKKKLLFVSSIGNLYLVIVSIIPLIIGMYIPMISNLAFYFGSVFMLMILLDNVYQEVKFICLKNSYEIF